MAKKKVYVCQKCNAYVTKGIDEDVPFCCGQAMIEMDEVEERDIYEEKEASGGI
jgi:hypothetical protein